MAPTDFSIKSTDIDDFAALRSGRAARLLAAGLVGRALLLGLELGELLVGLGTPDLLDSLGLGTQTRVLREGVLGVGEGYFWVLSCRLSGLAVQTC